MRTETVLPTLLAGLWLAGTAGCGGGEQSVSFQSQGVELQGTLVLPKHPITGVVFVHGSGIANRNIPLARRFGSEGIAAIVYDKRGTGKSGGRYEDNFAALTKSNLTLLAADASAAVGVRILVKNGSVVVEREGAQFELSHVEENRYSIFIEGDGYHFFRFNVAEGLMMIDEYDRYSRVTNK